MKQQRQIAVAVTTANEPIDLQKWANRYCRHVLELEGTEPLKPYSSRESEELCRRIDELLESSRPASPRLKVVKESVETEIDGRGVTVAVAPFYCHGEELVDHHTVSAATRVRILDRDGRVCGLCADIFGPFEIDHRTPICRGGTHEEGNLWVLCHQCNQDKGTQTVAEFADLLAWVGVSWLR